MEYQEKSILLYLQIFVCSKNMRDKYCWRTMSRISGPGLCHNSKKHLNSDRHAGLDPR